MPARPQLMVPDDGLSSVEVAAVRVADAAARVGARAVVDHRVDPRRRLRRRRAVEADAHALVADLDRDARLGGATGGQNDSSAPWRRHRGAGTPRRRRRRRASSRASGAFASAHERVVGATPAATFGGGTAMPVVQFSAPPRQLDVLPRAVVALQPALARLACDVQFQTHVVQRTRPRGRGSAELARCTPRSRHARYRRGEADAPRPCRRPFRCAQICCTRSHSAAASTTSAARS